jgi:hypothetical protein
MTEGGRPVSPAQQRAWAFLGITNWNQWELAPEHMNFTQAEAWAQARGLKGQQIIFMSSGDTLVQRTHDEFVCMSCRRLIQSFPAFLPPGADGLCGMCLHAPGWHNDPDLRDILDPDLAGAQADAAAWRKERNNAECPR